MKILHCIEAMLSWLQPSLVGFSCSSVKWDENSLSLQGWLGEK
jgi:hypothetical protein